MTSLKDQRATKLKDAENIIDAAKRENRGFTADEQAKTREILDEVDRIDARIKVADADQALLKQIGLIRPGMEDLPDEAAAGEMFTDDQKMGLLTAVRSKGSYGTLVKAPTLGGTLLPTSGQNVSLAPNALGAASLADLFDQQPATGPTVRVYKLTTGAAAVVAEGALKPDAGVVTTAVDVALKKIAATFQISDELAEDAPFLISSIQRQVTIGVLNRENQEIVSALSAGASVTATGTKAAAIDAFAAAIGAQEALNGITPSAALLSPADLAVIRQAKASTGGSYYVDPLTAGPSTLFGVPLVSTPAVPSGTAYLVSQGAGIMYRRGALRVETGFNADDWSRNLLTCRVEERVLPAVVRGELVSKITLT